MVVFPSTFPVRASLRLIAITGVLTAVSVLIGACSGERFSVDRTDDGNGDEGGDGGNTTAGAVSHAGTAGALVVVAQGGGGNGNTTDMNSVAPRGGSSNTQDASLDNENEGGLSGDAGNGDGGWVATCGEPGQACCGTSCNAADTFCGADGRCETCGGPGGVCCPDDSCQGGACCYGGLCVAENSSCSATAGQCLAGACEHCGGNTQECCAGVCRYELACSDGHCEACGAMDQRCCAGQTCGVGLGCAKNGSCVTCGGKDKPCCSGGSACNAPDLACTPQGGDDPALCRTCGRNGEVCCAAGTAGSVDDECEEGVCVAQNTSAGTVGFCRTNCGDTDQDCCTVPGSVNGCGPNLTCGMGNTNKTCN